jgi:hypothetical protein
VFAGQAGIPLNEWLEDHRQLFRLDAIARVFHTYENVVAFGQRSVRWCRRGPADDVNRTTRLTELRRVGKQVEQNLPDAPTVRDRGSAAGTFTRFLDGEPVLFDFRPYEANGFTDNQRRRNRCTLDRELAGFDFRQVENVVDQPQQMCAALLDTSQKLPLARSQRSSDLRIEEI